MDSYTLLDKVGKKYYKTTKKFLKKFPLRDYMKISRSEWGPHITSVCTSDKGIFVNTKLQEKQMERDTIVRTLKESNFRRGDLKWTPTVVAGFMDEVMYLYCSELPFCDRVHSKEVFDRLKKEISIRYNVPENKLKSEVAFIITRFFNNMDSYKLLYYFTYEELLLWKYRDIEKFQEDLENNKISQKNINIYKEIMNI